MAVILLHKHLLTTSSGFCGKRSRSEISRNIRIFIEVVFSSILLRLKVLQGLGPSSFEIFCVVCNALIKNWQAGRVRAPLTRSRHAHDEFLTHEWFNLCQTVGIMQIHGRHYIHLSSSRLLGGRLVPHWRTCSICRTAYRTGCGDCRCGCAGHPVWLRTT